MKVQIVGCTINSSGNDQRKENAKTSELKHYYPELSYRVCIHHLMPMRSCCSAVFLDKSLCISLEELAAGARRVQAPLYRSALSCQLGLPSLCRSTADKETDKNKGDRIGNFDKSDGQEHRLEHRGSSISKPHRRKATQKERTCGVNSKDHDSEKPSYSTFWGLSFREPSASNTKTTQHKGNANEAAFSPLSNFRHMDHSFTFIPVHSGMISKLEQESGKSTEPQIISTFHRRSSLKNDSVGGTIKTLSLKEALELFRPEFISRSKGRVRRLEQKASRRKALRDSDPDLVQDLIVAEDKQKRKCTKPDPLSDNLFKPRERFISGREMQLRSRRIYNKLPEVTKKKEEEKRRAVSEMNRVRAEVFKKRLLDKILQR